MSALDVSIQAQILNLLKGLQRELGLTCIFIGHGLGAVDYVSHRIAVMYLGKIVELGESREIFDHPRPPLYPGPAGGASHAGSQNAGQAQGAAAGGGGRIRGEDGGKVRAGAGWRAAPSIPGVPRREAACRTHRQELVSVDGTGRHLAACAPAAGGQQAAQTDALREEGRRP